MTEAHSTTTVEPRHAWLISLAFWLVLLTATVLYGAVALSPKWLQHLELKAEHHAGQSQLVALEQQIDYLERVQTALEDDPEFAAELARIDLAAATPGDERIAVDPELMLDANDPQRTSIVRSPGLPWYASAVDRLAHDQSLRRNALVIAACLVIGAFAFLHESNAAAIRSTLIAFRNGVHAVVGRYRR